MKDIVHEILSHAGELLINKKNNRVSLKADSYDITTLVSEADIEVNNVIINKLKSKYPTYSIFSEETGIIDNNSDKTWFLDPLDGTSNYLRNIPLWGISLGLVDKNDVTFGAIYLPALNQYYYAELGKGAYKNGKQIFVSKRSIDKSLFFGRSIYKNKLQLDLELIKKVGLVKIVDSSSFELSHIASGHGEIYTLKNVPHDVVAGVCLIREAGGKVTDFNGENWNIGSEGIIASNGIVHDDVLKYRDGSLSF